MSGAGCQGCGAVQGTEYGVHWKRCERCRVEEISSVVFMVQDTDKSLNENRSNVRKIHELDSRLKSPNASG